VERRINVQENRIHVVSQEGVDGKLRLISLMYSVELITVLIILPVIYKLIEIGGCYEM